MGKPKAKYVSATPTPEQARVQQNLGNFLAQYGTQNRGMYPGQLNAGMNPFLNMAGNMLSGMYGYGGGQNGSPGIGNQQPTPVNMTWNWPTMPTSFYTGPYQQPMQPPPPAPAPEPEKKKGQVFSMTAK
jgi:hypothetical protein